MKHRLISNHLYRRKEEHGGWKEPQGNDKIVFKKILPSSCNMK